MALQLDKPKKHINSKDNTNTLAAIRAKLAKAKKVPQND